MSLKSLAIACGGGDGGRGWSGTRRDRATAVPALGWRYGWARAFARGVLGNWRLWTGSPLNFFSKPLLMVKVTPVAVSAVLG